MEIPLPDSVCSYILRDSFRIAALSVFRDFTFDNN